MSDDKKRNFWKQLSDVELTATESYMLENFGKVNPSPADVAFKEFQDYVEWQSGLAKSEAERGDEMIQPDQWAFDILQRGYLLDGEKVTFEKDGKKVVLEHKGDVLESTYDE